RASSRAWRSRALSDHSDSIARLFRNVNDSYGMTTTAGLFLPGHLRRERGRKKHERRTILPGNPPLTVQLDDPHRVPQHRDRHKTDEPPPLLGLNGKIRHDDRENRDRETDDRE